MNDVPKIARALPISKETMISFGVAILIGSGCFYAGSYYEKVNRLDGLNIDKRLVRIEAKVDLMAQRLGIPPELRVHFRAVE